MATNKKITLYKGKIEIEFFEGSHRYTINGKSGIPSVTAITGVLNKPALVFWSANLAKDFLLQHLNAGTQITEELIIDAAKQHTIRKEQAAISGTKVHTFAEEYIKGKKPEMPEEEEVIRGVTAFLDWVKNQKVKFEASEKIVYSKKYNFVGIADAIATIENQRFLIDFKTSNAIYSEYFLQTAAYLHADSEESGRVYDGVKIGRFSKDTAEFEMAERSIELVEKDYKAFLGLLSTTKWLREQGF